MLKTEVKSVHFSTKNHPETSHLTQQRVQTETSIIWCQGISWTLFPTLSLQSLYSGHKGLLAHIRQCNSCLWPLFSYSLCLEVPPSQSRQGWLFTPDPTMPFDHRGLLSFCLLLPWFLFCISNFNYFSNYILLCTLVPISKHQIICSLSTQVWFCLLL